MSHATKTSKNLYRIILLAFIGIFSAGTAQSQDFITEWTFPSAASEIHFDAETVNGAVNYTWTTSPSNNSGSGSFTSAFGLVTLTGLTIDAGDVVTLSMTPTNLRRFYMLSSAADHVQLSNVSQWGAVAWTNMKYAFQDCANLQISATDVPNLAGVASMFNMFYFCTILNGPTNINSWNTSSVTDMRRVFIGAKSFNQNIGSWNTAKVTDMDDMFYSAWAFNQDISAWNTAAVTDMSAMFAGAKVFNQDISSWNTAAVTNMSYMFNNAFAFDQNIGPWTLNSGVNLGTMLVKSGMSCSSYGATLIGWLANNPSVTGRNLDAGQVQYGSNATVARNTLINTQTWSINDGGVDASCPSPNFISEWTFSAAATELHFNAKTDGAVDYFWVASPSNNSGSGSFTQSGAGAVTLSGLTIAAGDVLTLSMAPSNLRRFFISNGVDREQLTDIIQWGKVAWTSMDRAFQGCSNLQLTTTDLPVLTGVSSMAYMFNDCTSLNGPVTINSWNTSTVTDMGNMFDNASSFNQDIGAWNTTSVTNMGNLFYHAKTFNQNIGAWNTAAATRMSFMFTGALAFNQNIGNWNTGAVTDMSFMFTAARSFNQNIKNWNTAAATTMWSMFLFAVDFNQDIGSWTLNPNLIMTGMLDSCGMNCVNYSKTLIGWQTTNSAVNNRLLGASGLFYNQTAIAAHDTLIQQQGWTINDGGTLTSIDSITACNSYTWNGINYTKSNNTATQLFVTSAGCDSLVTLNLSITTVDTSVSVSGPSLTANATGASYVWIDCNNANLPLPGETKQNFTATASGSYAVIVTQNKCVQTSSCFEITMVGISEMLDKTIYQVLPNPSHGIYTIMYSGTKEIPYTLTDISGKIIRHGVLKSGNNTLTITEQSQGIYLLHTGGITTRLMKQ